MAGVIDLREDPRTDLLISSNIGQAVNTSINEYRRRKLEAGIVGTLQRASAEGYSPEQTRQELLKLPNIINTQIGQEMMQAQTETGRYYQHPMQREYLQSRINASNALTDYRQQGGASQSGMTQLSRLHTIRKNLYDQFDKADTMEDEATKKWLKIQIDYIDSQINALTGIKGTEMPSGIEAGIDNIDKTALGMNAPKVRPETKETPRSAMSPALVSNMYGLDTTALGMHPVKTPTKADTAISKELQQRDIIATAINPKTGERIGWNGKEWVRIQ